MANLHSGLDGYLKPLLYAFLISCAFPWIDTLISWIQAWALIWNKRSNHFISTRSARQYIENRDLIDKAESLSDDEQFKKTYQAKGGTKYDLETFYRLDNLVNEQNINNLYFTFENLGGFSSNAIGAFNNYIEQSVTYKNKFKNPAIEERHVYFINLLKPTIDKLSKLVSASQITPVAEAISRYPGIASEIESITNAYKAYRGYINDVFNV